MADEPAASPPPDPNSQPTPPTPPTAEATAAAGVEAAAAAPAPPADAAAAPAAEEPPTTEALANLDGAAEALKNVDVDLASAQESIDDLIKQANFEDPSAIAGGQQPPPTEGFDLPNFQQVMQEAQVSSIDLLRDVELQVKIELGRSLMLVEDVLKLTEGSVVELDKLAGDPVDVFVNDRLVARGEVLVLNDNFCVRVNEIVAGVKEEGL